MIRKEFVGRSNELDSLKRALERPGFEFIVLTGRRRVGKTRLLKEFSKDRDSIYLMCEKRKWQYNLDKFNRIIGEHFNIPNPNFGSFRDSFQFIASKEPNTLIIVDEFTYLRSNKEIFAEFQGITDDILDDTEITLMISGSYVSIMEKEILGTGSPLYGRTTGNLILRPLEFKKLFEWFSDISMTDALRLYGVCDGIPKYLEFFQGKDPMTEIEQNLFSPDTFLFREPRYLLDEELREPATYHQILEAISMGNKRATRIADYSYVGSKDISVYLNNLMELGYIFKEIPIMGKKSLYRLKDNLFRFWFRFTSPHYSDIESWNSEGAITNFRTHFDHYLGPVFEEVCMEFVRDWKKYPTVGRWWYDENEIDIVGVNIQKGEVLLGECKWNKKKMDRSVFYSLMNKAKEFRWKNGKREEEFILFSRGGFTDRLEKLAMEEKKLTLIDIKDMERHFKGKN